ncbi:MAG: helix-turn-helix transcriptional regulator [Bacteroidota bacterium]
MKSRIRAAAAKLDPITRRLVDIQGDIATHLAAILRNEGTSQRTLAERLKMKPAQLNKILAGNDNMTLRTIARLECATGSVLLESPMFRSMPGYEVSSAVHMVIPPGKPATEYPVTEDLAEREIDLHMPIINPAAPFFIIAVAGTYGRSRRQPS